MLSAYLYFPFHGIWAWSGALGYRLSEIVSATLHHSQRVRDA
jgi:hypothetical protein